MTKNTNNQMFTIEKTKLSAAQIERLAAFRKELAEAEDPDALKEQLYRKFEAIRSPFRTAESFLAEEIIDPRDTRRVVAYALDICDDAEQRQLHPNSFGVARL